MKFIISMILIFFSALEFCEQKPTIEASLTADSEFEKNIIDGSDVIKEMAKSGVFSKEPTERADYVSYYFPQTETHVFGYKLVYFDYEYSEEYIGCCVDPGAAIVIQVMPNNNLASIENFAKNNHCSIKKEEQIYMPNSIKEKIVKNGISISNIVEVSCKERDRRHFEDM